MFEDVSIAAAVLSPATLILSATIRTHSRIPKILVIPKRAARRNRRSRAALDYSRSPSPRSALSLPAHPPERTHGKPRERHCETNCSRHPCQPCSPGLIFCVFFRRCDPAAPCHHQENKPRNLQPQLMQHPPKRSSRRSHGASRRPHGPAALGLLTRHSRHHPQLSCS